MPEEASPPVADAARHRRLTDPSPGDSLLRAVETSLREIRLPAGSFATEVYGADRAEERVDLGPSEAVTYFIAGSTWQALSVYYDDLVGRSFYNPRRMLSGKPIVSIPYMFDEAMARSNPLDYESALASPIELHVVTTSVHRVAPRVLARFGSVDELRTALRASRARPRGSDRAMWHAKRSLLIPARTRSSISRGVRPSGGRHLASTSEDTQRRSGCTFLVRAG